MKGITADKVGEGAYIWQNQGMRHLGFIQRDKRGYLSGSFVAADGSVRAIILDYGDGTFAEGLFFHISMTEFFNET